MFLEALIMGVDIAVGLDGSDSSWKAFRQSMELASAKKVKLHVVSVQEEVQTSPSASEMIVAHETSKDKLQKIQQQAEELAKNEGLTVLNSVVKGNPVEAMVNYVKKNDIGVLVMGFTGHSSILGALLGTQAEKLVRHAPCTVMIVR